MTAVAPQSNPIEEPEARPWLAYVLLTVLTLLYFLTFFNRFGGLRSGNGEYVTGMAFLHGSIPYRDYFSATPPLNTFKSALLLHLFGPYLFVSRLAGVVERIAIVLLLYRWLRLNFGIASAFVASFVTIVVSAGDRSDPIASYNHDALLFAILSGYFTSRVLEAAPRRTQVIRAVMAGIFAALSILTKQTIGLGFLFILPLVAMLILLRLAGKRRAVTFVASFVLGVALPLAAFLAWLHASGVVGTFFTMTFLKGPAAKGAHLSDLLVRALLVARGNIIWISVAVVALLLASRPSLRALKGKTTTTESRPLLHLGAGCAVLLLSAEALALTHLPALYDFGKVSVYYTILATTILVAVYAWRLLRNRLDERQAQLALFALTSFLTASLLSLSWPAFEAMTLPGLALLVALALSGSRSYGRGFVYLICVAVVFLAVREKLDLPFAFGGLEERPVREATLSSELPELAGMRIPSQTNAFLTASIAAASQTNSKDTIFTYPEMAVLYELTHRGYPTQAESHNVDVVNDAFAREEAVRLQNNPPAVLISYVLTAEEVAQEDRTWRFGKPSGQHELAAAVSKLASQYHLAGKYAVGANGREVTVYLRP